MFATTVKKIVLATVVVAATASTSMAATWAWIDQDTNVKKHHKQSSMNVNYLHEGQKVKITGQWNNWYYVQIPGKDGWIKANKVDFHPNWNNSWGNGWGNGGNWNGGVGFGSSFCVNGKNAQFCLGASY